MTATAVLREARAAGVELSATPEGRIRWRCLGPLPEALRQQLVADKADLLLLLAKDLTPERHGLTEDELETYRERTVICAEYGHLPEAEALAIALRQVLDERQTRQERAPCPDTRKVI
jgi:hypothetical protein